MAPRKDSPKYDEWLQKVSKSHFKKGQVPWNKGHPVPEETRQKISKSLKGRKLSEERKQKMREAVKAALNRPEVRAKISEATRRAHQNSETERRRSEAISRAKTGKPGHPPSEKQKQRLIEVLTGDSNPAKRADVRKKISEALKGRSLTEEWREKLRRAHIGLRHSDATRAKMSKTRRENPETVLKGARASRLANPSSIELAIEDVLKALGISYESQKAIGFYVVDFYLPEHNLVIECDGEYWHNLPENIARDKRKDTYLRKRGYNILRLKEHEIKEGPEAALLNGLKVVR